MAMLLLTLKDSSVHEYTLLANPYPSQISFVTFQYNYNSIIIPTMWIFSTSYDNFSSYNGGILTNYPAGYAGTEDCIASGQAFFVQASTNSSVTFHETDKMTTTIPSNGYFGLSNNKRLF